MGDRDEVVGAAGVIRNVANLLPPGLAAIFAPALEFLARAL